MSPKTLGMIRITRSPNTDWDDNAYYVNPSGDVNNDNNNNVNNSYGRRPALILFYIRDLSN